MLEFASVSNLIPLKGIEDNIRASDILRHEHDLMDWRYSIVGDGPQRRDLEELTHQLDLSEHVRFLGRLPRGKTMAIMDGCDIFSLPSWGDAFGIVYVEAMARRKVVIGCKGWGAADIITDGKDGLLVPEKNPEALAAYFKALIADAALRERLAAAARQTAERFSWEINARRLLDLMEVGGCSNISPSSPILSHPNTEAHCPSD